jgi:hypothetical protein
MVEYLYAGIVTCQYESVLSAQNENEGSREPGIFILFSLWSLFALLRLRFVLEFRED